jgi:hypothetical protein
MQTAQSYALFILLTGFPGEGRLLKNKLPTNGIMTSFGLPEPRRCRKGDFGGASRAVPPYSSLDSSRMVAQGTDLRGRFADTLLVATCHREAIDEGRTSLYARSGTFHGADLGGVLVVGGKIGLR